MTKLQSPVYFDGQLFIIHALSRDKSLVQVIGQRYFVNKFRNMTDFKISEDTTIHVYFQSFSSSIDFILIYLRINRILDVEGIDSE